MEQMGSELVNGSVHYQGYNLLLIGIEVTAYVRLAGELRLKITDYSRQLHKLPRYQSTKINKNNLQTLNTQPTTALSLLFFRYYT